MRTIIIISKDIQFKWNITGTTEQYILSLTPEELDIYFEFKYGQLLSELRMISDAEVHLLNAEVEIHDS